MRRQNKYNRLLVASMYEKDMHSSNDWVIDMYGNLVEKEEAGRFEGSRTRNQEISSYSIYPEDEKWETI